MRANVIHCVLHGADLFRILIRNFNVKRFFKCHDQFHGIERVGAQIVHERSGIRYFALIDAQLTAGFARLSFVPIAIVGSAVISFLALRGQERALALVPSWMLFMVWLFAAAVTITGKVSGDIVVSALSAGLVVFLMLIGVTVTQYAFQSGDGGGAVEEAGQFKLRVMALEASGASVWEWDARRN